MLRTTVYVLYNQENINWMYQQTRAISLTKENVSTQYWLYENGVHKSLLSFNAYFMNLQFNISVIGKRLRFNSLSVSLPLFLVVRPLSGRLALQPFYIYAWKASAGRVSPSPSLMSALHHTVTNPPLQMLHSFIFPG